MPVITFPVGAGFEAVGAWLFVSNGGPMASPIHTVASVIIFINVVGGLVSYPAIVRKGIDAIFPKKEKSA